MMLIIILLLLSAGLNMILIFMLVRKYDEESLNIGVLEDAGMERIEYFDLHQSNSLLY
jgi:hypothetical protein